MKRLKLALILLMLFSSVSYGAASEDMSVYVRRDVFDVYMQHLNARIDDISETQKRHEQILNEITKTLSALTERVEGNYRNLDNRISDLRNDIYLGLVILGIIAALPSMKGFLHWREDRKAAITLEDVKRLIEENNAKVLKNMQV